MTEMFEYVGQLSPDKLREYENLCDIIIVVQSPEYKYEIPGKVIEAIGNFQPILALAERDSETGDVVTKYPLGVLALSTSVSSIREGLKRFISTNFSEEKVVKDLYLFVNDFYFENQLNKLRNIVSN
jgi:hypothetical protein